MILTHIADDFLHCDEITPNYIFSIEMNILIIVRIVSFCDSCHTIYLTLFKTSEHNFCILDENKTFFSFEIFIT